LHTWRVNVLNNLLTTLAIAGLPVVILVVLEEIRRPEEWLETLIFVTTYLLITGLAVFRRLDFRLRAWSTLLLGYVAGALAFARGGLAGDGRVYLLALPMLALILIGPRSGLAMTILSLLIFVAFAASAHLGWMADWLVTPDNSLLLMNWVVGGVFFALALIVLMTTQWHSNRLQRIIALENARLYEESEGLRTFNENIVQSMNEGIIVWGRRGHVTFVNPQVAELVNRPSADLIGQHWKTFVSPEYVTKVQEEADRLSGGSASRYEAALLDRDGQRVYVVVSTRPLFDGGRFTGALTVLTNITELERAEEARWESEEKYRNLVEHANDGIVLVQDGVCKFVNPRLAEIIGYSAEELIGTLFIEHIHSDQLAELTKYYERRMTGEEIAPIYETVIKLKDGKRLSVEVSASVITYQGKPAAFAIIRDITERKRVEEALWQRTAQLEALRQVELELTAQLDLDALLHSIVSRAMELLGGTSSGLYLYRPERDVLEWSVAIDPTTVVPLGTVLHRGEGLSGKIWESGKPLIVNGYGQWEGRASVWENFPVATVVGAPVRWGDEFLGVLNVAVDTPHILSPASAELLSLFAAQAAIAIQNARLYEQAQHEIAERKQTEEMLQRRTRELALLHHSSQIFNSTLDMDQVLVTVLEEARHLLNAVACSVWLFDPATDELVCRQTTDPRGEMLLGWRLAPGTGLADWAARHGESVIVSDTRSDERYFKGVDQKAKLELRSILSVPLQVKQNVIGVLQAVHTEVGHFGSNDLTLLEPLAASAASAIENARLYEQARREIAERERAEKELRESEKQLRQQERLAAIGQLAGGIAHDFNNILTAIILFAQAPMSKHDLPPDVVQALETILDESQRATKLVQQILDFGRRSAMETHLVDLASFTEEVINVLQWTIPENIQLIPTLESGEYVIEADSTRIQQVLLNLATNARDAMPEGGELRIGLARVEVRPGERSPLAGMDVGEWACLNVSDTGTGIPPDILPHIFEPFFTTKERGEGTGLGLAQVYGIVAQHKGHIDVETIVGEGTTFRVYLPACRDGEEKTPPKDKAPVIPEGLGETILLVEDEKKLREATRETLESLGYRVLTAVGGRQALEVYQTAGRVALVITEVIMPEMGGKRLLQELKEMNPCVQVLAITGYVVQKELEALKEMGFWDVVRKPFDANSLAKMIRQTLDAD
jgi:PAS domain S-box-containing protein